MSIVARSCAVLSFELAEAKGWFGGGGELQDGVDFADELHADGEGGFGDGAAELDVFQSQIHKYLR